MLFDSDVIIEILCGNREVVDRVALLDRGRLLRTFSADELGTAGSLEDLFLEQTQGRDDS